MKNIIKLITIYALAAAILLTLPVIGSAHETSADKTDVLALLSELEIMNGDPSGDLRLGDYVTRAEFTKVAVASSDYRHSVASNLSISPFHDTPHTHWAAPYVRVGVTNGLVTGYPDSSFRPENNVIFEEAVTIMLRVLGYTDSDFGASWPGGQIGMANNLDMTDNIENTSIGSQMTRGDVATLIYNTLRCSKKNTPTELISVFDVNFIEDATMISTSREDSAIPGDEVFTDMGSYKIRSDFDYSKVGMKGDIALKNNRTVIGFFPDQDASPNEKYVVYSLLGGDVVAYKDGRMEILDIPDSAAAYDGTQRSTYAAVRGTLEMGDIINVRRTNGNIDYVLFDKGGMMGPYTVTADSSYISGTGMSESTRISRGGNIGTVSDIRSNDVLYYVPDLDMAFVYTNKVTGVYESASPNKDNPTQVVVSGETYNVESAQAFMKLSSTGGIKYGETVTLLLGKTNDVADVLGGSGSAPTEIVGYAFATGTKTYSSGDLKNYAGNYIGIVAPNGETYEYTCDRDYSNFKNSVVTVSLNNGNASVSTVRQTTGASGLFDSNRMRLGSVTLTSDVKILDVGTTNSNDAPLYTTVYPARLDNVNIPAGKVLYSHKNAAGEIDQLILNDMTGDSYTFGLAKSVNNISMGPALSGSYEYIVNGTTYPMATSGKIFSISRNSGIKLSSAVNPVSMSNLTELDGNITVTGSTSLTSGGRIYAISPNVQVYEKPYQLSDTYKLIPISDIVGSDTHTIYAYYDKLPENGGRIRILVAVKK